MTRANVANEKPPSPPGVPLLGHVPAFIKDPPGFLRRAFELDDVVRLNVGGWRYAVHKPEHIKQILHDEHRAFRKGMDESRFVPLFGSGLILSEGELWKRQRRLIQPAFLRSRLDTFAGATNARTREYIERWKTHVTSGQPFDMHAEAMALTLVILGDTVFSTDLSERDPKHMGDALATALAITIARYFSPVATPMWLPTPTILRYKRALASLRQVVDDMISRRRSEPAVDDLLGRLMAATDDETAPMTDSQLRDEALNMMLAGHETSALTLSWTLWELGHRADLQDAIAAEAEAVLGDAEPSAATTHQLKRTLGAVEEALRLHPPIWIFQRVATEAVTVGGYPVEPGAVVWLVPYLTHRDPEFWPDPERYDPTRFDDAKAARSNFAYYPFGGGPRLCVGANLALAKTVMIVSSVLRHFRVVPVSERPPEDEYSFTLRPKSGVWLRLEAR